MQCFCLITRVVFKLPEKVYIKCYILEKIYVIKNLKIGFPKRWAIWFWQLHTKKAFLKITYSFLVCAASKTVLWAKRIISLIQIVIFSLDSQSVFHSLQWCSQLKRDSIGCWIVLSLGTMWPAVTTHSNTNSFWCKIQRSMEDN